MYSCRSIQFSRHYMITSVFSVEISIHGLKCWRITRHSEYIIHESRLYFMSFPDSSLCSMAVLSGARLSGKATKRVKRARRSGQAPAPVSSQFLFITLRAPKNRRATQAIPIHALFTGQFTDHAKPLPDPARSVIY